MPKTRKAITGYEVDALICIKWGRLVTTPNHVARLSNARIGKLLGMSGGTVRKLYLARMVELYPLKNVQRPLNSMAPMTKLRKRYGLKHLSEEHQAYLTSPDTLRQHVGLSLKARCQMFHRLHPEKKINPSLLKEVYKKHGVKKKAICFKKVVRPEKVEDAIVWQVEMV